MVWSSFVSGADDEAAWGLVEMPALHPYTRMGNFPLAFAIGKPYNELILLEEMFIKNGSERRRG